MFEANDEDFDIDEEFLQDVFQTGTVSEKCSNEPRPEKRRSDENSEDKDSLVKKLREGFTTRCSKDKSEDHNILSNLEESFKEEAFYCSDEFAQYQEAPSPENLQNLEDHLSESQEGGFDNLANDSLFKEPNGVLRRNQQGSKEHAGGSKPGHSSKRKFPGPAGLLPHLGRSSVGADLAELDKDSTVEKQTTAVVPLSSQSPSESSSSSAWLEAVRALEVRPGEADCALGRFTVAWVRQRAAARRLPQHKVPFLLVGVRSVDTGTRDPSVILQDPSGEMHGILHRELWLEFSSQLVSGSVLALRQVGVMSTGPFARHQCLNVTANNLIAIFSPEGSQGTRTTHVRPVSRTQLLREVSTPASPMSPAPGPPSSLFSTVGNSTPTRSLNPPARATLNFPKSPSVASERSVSSFGSPAHCSTPKHSNPQRFVSGGSKPNTPTSQQSSSSFRPQVGSAVQKLNPQASQQSNNNPRPQFGNTVSQLNPPTSQQFSTPRPQLGTQVARPTPPIYQQSQAGPRPQVDNNVTSRLTQIKNSSSGIDSNSNAHHVTPSKGFALATLPCVSKAPAIPSRPPLNSVNCPDQGPKSAFFTPKRASSSTQVAPTPPAPSIPPDLDSLLEGLDTDALFGDF